MNLWELGAWALINFKKSSTPGGDVLSTFPSILETWIRSVKKDCMSETPLLRSTALCSERMIGSYALTNVRTDDVKRSG